MTTSTDTDESVYPDWKLILKERHTAALNPHYLQPLIIIAKSVIKKVTGSYGEKTDYPLALITAPFDELTRKMWVFCTYLYLILFAFISSGVAVILFIKQDEMPLYCFSMLVLTASICSLAHIKINRTRPTKIHKFEHAGRYYQRRRERMITKFVHAFEFLRQIEWHVGDQALSEATTLEDLQTLAKESFRSLAECVSEKIGIEDTDEDRAELRFLISTSITLGIFAPDPGTLKSDLSKELYTEAFRQDPVAQPA